MERIKNTLAYILVLMMLTAAVSGCGGQTGGSADSAQTGSTGTGREAAAEADPSAEKAAAGTGETGGAGQAEGEADIALADIPENPYHREDGGVSIDVFAMDTYMTLLAYGDRAEEAVLAAAKEIHSLDDRLSTGNAQSEISRLNAAGEGSASGIVQHLVEQSLMLYKETGGLFDIAIYPVMKLWGFPTQDFRVPDKAEIDAALKLADASAITIVTKPVAGDTAPAKAAAVPAPEAEAATAAAAEAREPGTEVREPSAGKKTPAKAAAQEPAAEAATAAAAEVQEPAAEVQAPGTEAKEPSAGKKTPAKAAAQEPAAEAATAAAAEVQEPAAEARTQDDEIYPVLRFGIPGMEIDLGGIAKGYTGNRVMEIFKEYGIRHGIISLGGNVQALGGKEDGSPWRIAIQNPESGQGYLGILDIKDRAVITSGGYERFFEEGGVRYHHIIDPRTGYPADSGLISATIISADGTLADGLSTSLFIMGKEEAEKYWRAHAEQFEYILEAADGTLYVTEGAADILTTDAKTVVIRR